MERNRVAYFQGRTRAIVFHPNFIPDLSMGLVEVLLLSSTYNINITVRFIVRIVRESKKLVKMDDNRLNLDRTHKENNNNNNNC